MRPAAKARELLVFPPPLAELRMIFNASAFRTATLKTKSLLTVFGAVLNYFSSVVEAEV